MILPELIAFLQRTGAHPKKRLSQNFLIDPSVVKQIVQTAEATEEPILEIGPGPGALTSALLKQGSYVYAVEMDPLFAKELERFQNGRLRIFQADILSFPLEHLPKPIKVVANLPYHITTPILERLFALPFSTITIMVQKEVAERMSASAGSKTFGSLSLFVQFHASIHSHFPVPAASFYPKPKVDSTVIRLDRKPLPPIDPTYFFSLVHKAFQQRRKMLTSSLPFPKEAVQQALTLVGAPFTARPEALSFEQWVQLATVL
jgi:16S rRNA (adenine1518-N6/adenine1519-N6)-dimethyltransferase